MIGLEVRWRRLALVAALAIVVAVASSVAAALGRRSLPVSWRVVLSSRVRHVSAGGVDFAYRVIGSGRPLLLIEGTEATMASEWDPGVLAQIAASHRVIVYDPRGLGLSRGDVSHMTVAQLADDAAHLLGALHVRQADVWGQSLGGDVAQELTIRHPRDVRRLVLTGTSAGGGHWVPPLVPLPKPKGDDRAEILRVTFTPGPSGRAAARAFEARVGLWRPQENCLATGANRRMDRGRTIRDRSSAGRMAGASDRQSARARGRRTARCGRPAREFPHHRGSATPRHASPLSLRT